MTVLEEIIAAETPWPDVLPDHLSPSSLKTYMWCRESWRRKYLSRERERSAHYFVWGGAHNHALIDTNYAQKITTGTDLPVKEVQEVFAAAVDAKTEAAGGDSEVDWGKEMSRAKIKDDGVGLVAAYMTSAAPSVQPVAVEKRFEIDVAGVPVPLVGYLDVLTADKVVELKTAAKRELAPADVFQGRVYQLAEPLPVDFHIATKTKTPAVYTAADFDDFGIPLSAARSEATRLMVVNLVADIAATLARFGPDAAWPGAYAVRSTCGLCSFKSTCSWWSS